MTAHGEPTSLESVAHALLLARQDIEAVLAGEPAWQAMRHLAHSADANSARERELLAARLALVPAYRSLRRINEALHGLAVYVAGQSAGRSSSWAASLSSAMPSLQQAAHEAELESGAGGGERLLSGWHSSDETRRSVGNVERPPIDLERLISLIRRGTKDRRPQPLQGMLASSPGHDGPQRDAAAEDRRLVFPETVPDVDRGASRASDEPIDLVPVPDRRGMGAPDDREIVVDEARPTARVTASAASLGKVGQMEAEIEVFASGKPADAAAQGIADAIPLRPIEPAAILSGEEAAVDIIVPEAARASQSAGDDAAISAATGVRRFMSAWNDRGKR